MKEIIFRMWRGDIKDFNVKMSELRKQGDSATWDLHKPAMDLKKIVDVFGNVVSLQMIYKLWRPGIFTCQEVQKELKMDIKYVKDMVRYLEELGIVEVETRGIYGRGPNGNLAMNLFAWILLNAE